MEILVSIHAVLLVEELIQVGISESRYAACEAVRRPSRSSRGELENMLISLPDIRALMQRIG